VQEIDSERLGQERTDYNSCELVCFLKEIGQNPRRPPL
jgi:hypothetical protein